MNNSNTPHLIEVIERTREDEHIEHNYRIVNPYNIPQNQNTTIWMIGGNSTTNIVANNGNAKIAESLVDPEARKKTTIYSFGFNGEPLTSPIVHLRNEYDQDIRTIYHSSIEPLFYDQYGEPKKKKGIEQTLEKNIFVSHCGGAVLTNIIFDEIFQTISKILSEGEAKILMNKIPYIAYTPLTMPNYNMNSLIIAPYVDQNFSWSNALDFANTYGIDKDYPKGAIKKLNKAHRSQILSHEFKSIFEDTRAVLFKTGNISFLIPSQMNPNYITGDHTIECLSKKHIQNSGTPFESTAQLARKAALLYMKSFSKGKSIDTNQLYNSIQKLAEETPPAPQRY